MRAWGIEQGVNGTRRGVHGPDALPESEHAARARAPPEARIWRAPKGGGLGARPRSVAEGVLATRADASHTRFEFIAIRYDRQRRHSTRGYKTPVAYEQELQHAN